MKALVFPGQGSQYPGMATDLVAASPLARQRFTQAADVLGFDIFAVLREGTEEDLKRTAVTQPAIFIHSVVLAEVLGLGQTAQLVAGHSLGEFSALVVAGALDFEAGLALVKTRAEAMQRACDLAPSTMAAIVGLDDAAVEALCAQVPGVVPANYNAPGQLVVSGSVAGIEQLVALAKPAGAKLAKVLPVGGAFHSPFMQPAQDELAQGIEAANFVAPRCPVYQNVDGLPQTDPVIIRQNLVRQLTAAVRWTQTVARMAEDGATEFVEVGPGKVLQGLVKRIAPAASVAGVDKLPTTEA
ncbi:MAG: ACP S-malonyltransferase [Bacteroidia bacterium]|nr:ACP S-malonyltransferase [Bacteroidia bacterium]